MSQPPYSEPYQPAGGQPPYSEPYQPAGGQPPYYPPAGQVPYYPPTGQARGTNVMAILALVFAFVFSPLAIVFGHIARRQIGRTGEQGSGLATAGLVLGYIFTVFTVIYIIVLIALVAHGISTGSAGTAG